MRHVTGRLVGAALLTTAVVGTLTSAAALAETDPAAPATPVASVASVAAMHPTSTTAPPTSTTTTSTTTVVPAPPPAPTEPLPSPDPGYDPANPTARATAALEADVPGVWHAAAPVTFAVVGGSTSLAHDDGTIEMGSAHLSGPWEKLEFVVAHEFGHQLAYRYGTSAYLGAGPAGFPAAGAHPEEHWADCVAAASTGVSLAGHRCEGNALSFTAAWLAAGPPG